MFASKLFGARSATRVLYVPEVRRRRRRRRRPGVDRGNVT